MKLVQNIETSTKSAHNPGRIDTWNVAPSDEKLRAFVTSRLAKFGSSADEDVFGLAA